MDMTTRDDALKWSIGSKPQPCSMWSQRELRSLQGWRGLEQCKRTGYKSVCTTRKIRSKTKQITNFPYQKRDVASTWENSSGQCFELFISMDQSTSKYRKKICVGQEMRAFSFFLSALFSSTTQKKLISFKMVKQGHPLRKLRW